MPSMPLSVFGEVTETLKQCRLFEEQLIRIAKLQDQNFYFPASKILLNSSFNINKNIEEFREAYEALERMQMQTESFDDLNVITIARLRLKAAAVKIVEAEYSLLKQKMSTKAQQIDSLQKSKIFQIQQTLSRYRGVLGRFLSNKHRLNVPASLNDMFRTVHQHNDMFDSLILSEQQSIYEEQNILHQQSILHEAQQKLQQYYKNRQQLLLSISQIEQGNLFNESNSVDKETWKLPNEMLLELKSIESVLNQQEMKFSAVINSQSRTNPSLHKIEESGVTETYTDIDQAEKNLVLLAESIAHHRSEKLNSVIQTMLKLKEEVKLNIPQFDDNEALVSNTLLLEIKQSAEELERILGEQIQIYETARDNPQFDMAKIDGALKLHTESVLLYKHKVKEHRSQRMEETLMTQNKLQQYQQKVKALELSIRQIEQENLFDNHSIDNGNWRLPNKKFLELQRIQSTLSQDEHFLSSIKSQSEIDIIKNSGVEQSYSGIDLEEQKIAELAKSIAKHRTEKLNSVIQTMEELQNKAALLLPTYEENSSLPSNVQLLEIKELKKELDRTLEEQIIIYQQARGNPQFDMAEIDKELESYAERVALYESKVKKYQLKKIQEKQSQQTMEMEEITSVIVKPPLISKATLNEACVKAALSQSSYLMKAKGSLKKMSSHRSDTIDKVNKAIKLIKYKNIEDNEPDAIRLVALIELIRLHKKSIDKHHKKVGIFTKHRKSRLSKVYDGLLKEYKQIAQDNNINFRDFNGGECLNKLIPNYKQSLQKDDQDTYNIKYK